VRRVGPHGWYVPLARRLASGGLTVLRIDLGGLGDSAPRPSSRHRPVYPTEAVDDVRLAVEWLRREQGVEQVHLLGLCSGAYHAFKAAVAGVPLASALMLNPLTFFWREGLSLDPELAEHRVALQAADYGRAVWKAERWLKLLRGQVDLRLLSRVMARRVANLLRHRARAAGRLLGWPLKDDLAGELHLADRHGVALQFVFSPQDPGLVLLREQGGPAVSRLARRGRLGLRVLEEGDHTFSAVGSRGALFAHVAQVLRA
jgi:pimeloyl-ACP methyl ester carboxylesterase